MRFASFGSLLRTFVMMIAATNGTVTAQGATDRWSSIGPESEPTVHSLAVDPTEANTIYVGAIGTIWRTDDGGRNWTSAATPLTGPCEIRALVIDPIDRSTLYAGCFGAIKSTDGGRSWSSSHSGMESGGALPAVWAIAIDPRDAQTLYAATPQGKVFKSVNSGTSWTATSDLPNGAAQVRALVIDAAATGTVYAAATRGGVFKTVDGGTKWTAVNTGLPTTEVTTLAIDSRSPATLYAGTIGRGIFKTTDAAASWVEVFGERELPGVDFTVAELVMDPFHPPTLYAGMGDPGSGAFQTTNGGATWRRLDAGLPPFVAIRALAVAPSSPSTLYSGTVDQYPGTVDGGVFTAVVTNRCPAEVPATIHEFPVPTADSSPLGIAGGPDCAVWFTEAKGNKIGRISLRGEIIEYAVPTAASEPARITAGPDGALWFTEFRGNKIGRITTAGAITEYTIPTPRSSPIGITAGPDGNIWFTEADGHKIGRITPAGAITEFLIPPLGGFPSFPRGITAGRDGNLWFSEFFTGRVGRITTEGVITLFVVEPSCCASLGEITAGPDGNIWFIEEEENRIVRVTPEGKMDYFAAAEKVYGIVGGPDKALWVTYGPSKMARLTTDGIVSELVLPTKDARPQIVTVGPDGHIWFTEMSANKIGRIPIVSSPPPGRRRPAVRP